MPSDLDASHPLEPALADAPFVAQVLASDVSGDLEFGLPFALDGSFAIARLQIQGPLPDPSILAASSAALPILWLGFPSLNTNTNLGNTVGMASDRPIGLNAALKMESAQILGTTLATPQNLGAPTFSLNDAVSGSNRQDFFQFTATQSGVFTATLKGLTGDADVQLIQDKNQNGKVDPGEILAWQWERGTQTESIRSFLSPGNYVVRVESHQGQTAQYELASQFNATLQDDRSFSMDLVYKSGLEGLSQASKDAIQRAADYWERIIAYSSLNGSQSLTVGVYGSRNETDPFLAYAGPQGYQKTLSDRLVPVRGVAVVNTLYLDQYNSNPTYLEEVMRHEFGHVLGFGLSWNQVGNNLVDSSQQVYRANTYAGLAYGELLGSNQGVAIPLDDEKTHWSEAIFDRELMTPRAETVGSSMPLSQMSIASLRDLGWNVNYGAADIFTV